PPRGLARRLHGGQQQGDQDRDDRDDDQQLNQRESASHGIAPSGGQESWNRRPGDSRPGRVTSTGRAVRNRPGFRMTPMAREDFEYDLGLELRRERPASAFRHERTLPGGPY